jgi:hypothetical protein
MHPGRPKLTTPSTSFFRFSPGTLGSAPASKQSNAGITPEVAASSPLPFPRYPEAPPSRPFRSPTRVRSHASPAEPTSLEAFPSSSPPRCLKPPPAASPLHSPSAPQTSPSRASRRLHKTWVEAATAAGSCSGQKRT